MTQLPPSQYGEPMPPPPPAPQQSNGLAIASMVLGIASCAMLVFGCCLWFVAIVSIPLGITGLVLGVRAKNQAKETGSGKGMAKAGIILSIVGLACGIVVPILGLVGMAAFMGHHGLHNMPHGFHHP